MKEWLRKLRGLGGIGATWGAAWGVFGAGIGWVIGLVSPEFWLVTNPVIDWAVGMGLYGAVSGVAFGGLLALREGRKRLLELSLPRVAALGVLGSGVVPLLFGALGMFGPGTSVADVVGAMVVTASLGGVFAPGSLALARRAELASGESAELLKD